MKQLVLLRDDSSDHGTLGVLAGGGLRLHVIEPPWRGNRCNRSCIPAGAYDALPHVSPRFGRSVLVAGVPGRSHILIHAGNLGGDVDRGLRTHTLGCLLPGLRRGDLVVAVDGGRRRQKAVLASRTALRRLFAWAGDRPFRLEIAGAPPRPFMEAPSCSMP